MRIEFRLKLYNMLEQMTLKRLRIPHSGFRIPDSRFLTFHKPYKNMADSNSSRSTVFYPFLVELKL